MAKSSSKTKAKLFSLFRRKEQRTKKKSLLADHKKTVVAVPRNNSDDRVDSIAVIPKPEPRTAKPKPEPPAFDAAAAALAAWKEATAKYGTPDDGDAACFADWHEYDDGLKYDEEVTDDDYDNDYDYDYHDYHDDDDDRKSDPDWENKSESSVSAYGDVSNRRMSMLSWSIERESFRKRLAEAEAEDAALALSDLDGKDALKDTTKVDVLASTEHASDLAQKDALRKVELLMEDLDSGFDDDDEEEEKKESKDALVMGKDETERTDYEREVTKKVEKEVETGTKTDGTLDVDDEDESESTDDNDSWEKKSDSSNSMYGDPGNRRASMLSWSLVSGEETANLDEVVPTKHLALAVPSSSSIPRSVEHFAHDLGGYDGARFVQRRDVATHVTTEIDVDRRVVQRDDATEDTEIDIDIVVTASETTSDVVVTETATTMSKDDDHDKGDPLPRVGDRRRRGSASSPRASRSLTTGRSAGNPLVKTNSYRRSSLRRSSFESLTIIESAREHEEEDDDEEEEERVRDVEKRIVPFCAPTNNTTTTADRATRDVAVDIPMASSLRALNHDKVNVSRYRLPGTDSDPPVASGHACAPLLLRPNDDDADARAEEARERKNYVASLLASALHKTRQEEELRRQRGETDYTDLEEKLTGLATFACCPIWVDG